MRSSEQGIEPRPLDGPVTDGSRCQGSLKRACSRWPSKAWFEKCLAPHPEPLTY
jgi:hypothetical protein